MSKRYDAVSLKKAEKLRNKYGTKLILDICDNHFFSDNNAEFWDIRSRSLKEAILAMDLVICSSETLASIVLDLLDKPINVSVIGDFVEKPFSPDILTKTRHPFSELSLCFYKRKLNALNTANGRKLIWFGNHGSKNATSGMQDILLIKDQLSMLHQSAPIVLTIVSNSKNKYQRIANQLSIPTIYVEWNQYTFSRVMYNNDIAIIPISPNPFTICKTNNRLTTAITHNLQVASTSIPSYEEFKEYITLDNWQNGLEILMLNKGLRNAGIQACQSIIDQRYTLSKIVDKWQDCLIMTNTK